MSTRVSIVTGASRGIGFFIAKALAEDFGHHVIVTGRNVTRLEDLANQTQGTITVAPADITSEQDRQSIHSVVDTVCQHSDHHFFWNRS